MPGRGINRLSAESIDDVDDVKAWARDQEIRIEQLVDAISELVDVHEEQQRKIGRNLNLILTASAASGFVLLIVVLLFGIPQIIRNLF